MKKVLIVANPDLNYIDGSSIWAQSITLLLAKSGFDLVHFLAKSTPNRSQIFEPFDDYKSIKVIDGTLEGFWFGQSFSRLESNQMVKLANQLDENFRYDLVVTRGYELAQELFNGSDLLQKAWVYLTDIPQSISKLKEKDKQVLSNIHSASLRILCQSKGFLDIWRHCAHDFSSQKEVLFPPVIPDFSENILPLNRRLKKAVYAGKFKPEWNTLEMVNIWNSISEGVPDAELIMIGDKIDNPSYMPDYHGKMENALTSTENLDWLGAQSRNRVQEELEKSKLGLSWRDESMNDTFEYSTKILEYGRAGCGVIMNRNPLHESLFGDDYPLFVNSPQEFEDKVSLALSDDQVLESSASRVQEVAKSHTMSARMEDIRLYLKQDLIFTESKELDDCKKTILVAGHDLKFFHGLRESLESTGKYNFIIDQWHGHTKHDERESFKLLLQADVIFCEWCLGNIEWYSKYKLPYQYLVGRFHLQEKDLPYLSRSNLSSIDHIAYVSSQIMSEANKKDLPIESKRQSVVSNFLDAVKFTAKKKVADSQFTLGIIGSTPARKRLDRAIDLLEILLKKDSRYTLRVKGRFPLDYPWIINRKDEVEYYMKIMERINSNEHLRYRVIFDPAGDDVNDWMTLYFPHQILKVFICLWVRVCWLELCRLFGIGLAQKKYGQKNMYLS